jgi:hypothetical protein
MSDVPSPPEMVEERTTRFKMPPISPIICAHRVELLKMTMNHSLLTDEQKYADVVACVRNWTNIDLMPYLELIHDTWDMPSSDEETPAPDAGERPPKKKRLASANGACVSCVMGMHGNINVKA